MERPLAAPRSAIAPAGWLPSREHVKDLSARVTVHARRFLLSDLFAIFLATRLGYVLLTYFGLALFHDPALVGEQRTGFSGYLITGWFYRDSQWFHGIVSDGYQYFGPGVRASVAFFPVFPSVVKALTLLTGLDPDAAAMLVANVSFLGAMIFLQKLCRREYGEATAKRAVLYMAVFPTAFFSFAPYSEALFLVFSLACLYYSREHRWWLAGLLGGLAAGTRVQGVLLAIPFAVEYLSAHRLDPRQFRPSVLAGALIPAGLGTFMLYLYGLTGDPLAFVRAEAGWNRGMMWPWQVIATSLADVPKTLRYHPYFQAHALMENGLLLVCLLLLIVGVRLVPISFSLYGLAYVAVTVSAPVTSSDIPITSISRYLFVVVPLYVVLARLGRWPIFDRLYLMLATGSLALFTTLFLNHMWGA
jgi:hypothetical protein